MGSEMQWFWEFTYYRSEMLKNSSEKLNFIPNKKRNKRQSHWKSKIFRLPFLITQKKRFFDQNSFTIQVSLGVFMSKISHGILVFAVGTFQVKPPSGTMGPRISSKFYSWILLLIWSIGTFKLNSRKWKLMRKSWKDRRNIRNLEN
jgi:hypothetical protein